MAEQAEKEVVEELVREFRELEGDRHNWEAQWQEIAEYVIPRRADFIQKWSPGEKRRNKIYEGTAVRALTRFSAGIHNTLTNASMPWFQLTVDRELQQSRDVQLWLEESQRRLLHVFSRPESNFHPAAHEYYTDLGAFGTGCMLVYDMPGRGPMFRTFPMAECYLQINYLGRVDSVYRKIEKTAKQLVEEFGLEAVSETVSKAYTEGKLFDKYDCLHVVRPRKNAQGYGAQNMPYMSIYVCPLSENHVVQLSGFEEFPYVCSRWERNSEEIYGRGPGVEALPDIKMINKMEELSLKSLAKIVDPPLLVPDDGFLSPIRTTPGGLNFFRAGMSPNDRIIPLETRGRPDLNEAKSNQVRDAINRAFYLDMLELPGPTAPDGDVLRFSATEVVQRQRDRLGILGPVVARQEVEFLGPLIERTLNIMLKNGMLPDVPQELMESEYGIEYTNPVGIAQRTGELTSISTLMQFLTPMAQIDPNVIKRLDTGRTASLAAEILRVPPSVFKTDAEMQEEIEAEAQMMARQNQIQENMAVAQANNLISMAERNRSQAQLASAKAAGEGA